MEFSPSETAYEDGLDRMTANLTEAIHVFRDRNLRSYKMARELEQVNEAQAARINQLYDEKGVAEASLSELKDKMMDDHLLHLKEIRGLAAQLEASQKQCGEKQGKIHQLRTNIQRMNDQLTDYKLREKLEQEFGRGGPVGDRESERKRKNVEDLEDSVAETLLPQEPIIRGPPPALAVLGNKDLNRQSTDQQNGCGKRTPLHGKGTRPSRSSRHALRVDADTTPLVSAARSTRESTAYIIEAESMPVT